MASSGKVLVFGGRGFVGAAVCKELAKRGVTPVLSLGRSMDSSGGPVDDKVEQKSGIDALRPETFAALLPDTHAVVISMGLPPWITNRDKALSANGATNVSVLKAAAEHKLPRIVIVNATMPSWGLISNYREGKEMAEEEARRYAETCGAKCGVLILKPGVVSGTRYAGSIPIPLWCVFAPMRSLFQLFASPCQALEGMFPNLLGGVLRPAVYAEEMAAAAADAINDPDFEGVRVLGPEDLVGYKSRTA